MTIRTPLTVSADVVHAEFELRDSSHPFVGLSTVEDCEIELEEILPRKVGGYRGFYSVRDSDPGQLLRQATTYEGADARFVDRTDDGGLLELSLSETCPAMFLAEERAFPRRVSAAAGRGRIAAEFIGESGADGNDTVDAFLGAYPNAELLVHRQQSYHTPLFSLRELDRAIEGLLTDRQLEVLRTAHEAGYYEWPRGTTGEEVAQELGISPSTFTEHIRAAERKLVGLLLD